MCSQPEQQLLQAPQIWVTLSCPQAPAPSLWVQQEEINRLTCVVEKWSAEEPHRVQESATYYHTMGRNGSSFHCSTSNIPLVPLDTRQHRNYDSQGHNRYSNYNRRSQHYNRPEADHRRYFQTLPNTHCSNINTANSTTPYTQLWHTQIQPKCGPLHNLHRNQSALGWSWAGILKLLHMYINSTHLTQIYCSHLTFSHSSTLHYRAHTTPCYMILYRELNKEVYKKAKQYQVIIYSSQDHQPKSFYIITW